MVGSLRATGFAAACLAVVALAPVAPSVAQVEAGGPLGPYTPPACVPGVPFSDITCTTGFDPWIEQFGLDGITAGCGGGLYCPGTAVTRDQMAVFIEKSMRGTANWPAHTQIVWAVKNSAGSPDPTASGTALLNAVAAIPTTGNDAPSSTNPWLLKVGPGIFDLASGSLTLPAYTALEGAGRETTVITATGYADNAHGTVIVGNLGRLSRLTVANTGGGSFEIPVFLPQNSSYVKLEHVTLLGSNPSNASGAAYGLRTDINTSFSLADCELTAHGAGTNYGIVANTSSDESWIDSSRINVSGASGSGTDYGFYSASGNPTVTNSRLYVSDGAGQYGIYAIGVGGALDLRNTEIYTYGGGAAVYINSLNADLVGDLIFSASGYGISTNGGGPSANITASTISGGTNWLYNGAGYTVTVGASKLAGTTVNAGTVHCFGNFTASAFYSNTCP